MIKVNCILAVFFFLFCKVVSVDEESTCVPNKNVVVDALIVWVKEPFPVDKSLSMHKVQRVSSVIHILRYCHANVLFALTRFQLDDKQLYPVQGFSCDVEQIYKSLLNTEETTEDYNKTAPYNGTYSLEDIFRSVVQFNVSGFSWRASPYERCGSDSERVTHVKSLVKLVLVVASNVSNIICSMPTTFDRHPYYTVYNENTFFEDRSSLKEAREAKLRYILIGSFWSMMDCEKTLKSAGLQGVIMGISNSNLARGENLIMMDTVTKSVMKITGGNVYTAPYSETVSRMVIVVSLFLILGFLLILSVVDRF